MPLRVVHLAKQGHRRALRLRCYVLVCLLAAGCRVPPAQFPSAQAFGTVEYRSLALAQQVVTDSSLEVARDPVHCSWEILYGAGDRFWCSAQGELGKRFLLPLAGTPDELPAPGPPAPLLGAHPGTGPEGRPLQPATVQLYREGNAALAALEQMIATAQHRIDVLMFEWEGDAVGNALAAQLAAKAGPNLRVRILVDGGGNLIFGRPRKATASEINQAVYALSQQPYVEVLRTRNPFGRFDHRKLVLVDGRIAWSGGRNFVRRVFYDQHDLSFTFSGPLAAELAGEFEDFWTKQGGRPATPGGPAQLVEEDGVRQAQHHAAAPPPPPNAWAVLVHTKPTDHQLQRVLYQAVDGARHYIYLENVYLCDSLLVYKLAQARRRGVDVRVVLTVTSTNCVINASNRVTANRLHKAGVRVYCYPGMTHVKAATIDDCWAYVGTANFDPLSLRRNYEVGLVACSGTLIQELNDLVLLRDCCPDWEVRAPLSVSPCDYACELLSCLYL